MNDSYGLEWTKTDETHGLPGVFYLDETGPLCFGRDGEEGIYCDSEDDLRLINNAPGLLKALKDLLFLVKSKFQVEDYAARAIIAKIEGKTP